MHALGRRTPDNWEHVEKYPLRAIAEPVSNFTVNNILALPTWHAKHNQGQEGSCVGHGKAMTLAILNTIQRRNAGTLPYTQRYNPFWIWNRSKERDEWSDTNPGDNNGTSVNASCSVVRDLGAPKWGSETPYLNYGIHAYRWATDVDMMRQCLAFGVPITIGVDWYTNFDNPVGGGTSIYIGKGDLGRRRGGHSVCIYGASDRRQAFRIKNSWGSEYPLVWMPYETMEKLLNDGGEAAIITDR